MDAGRDKGRVKPVTREQEETVSTGAQKTEKKPWVVPYIRGFSEEIKRMFFLRIWDIYTF